MCKRPYILSILCSTVLAIVVWSVVPKEYAAFTKLSDESTETDIAIGLNSISARLNKSLVSRDNSINSVEVYCQSLKTTDFARAISEIQVPGISMDYGGWVMSDHHFWQTKDTVEAVMRNIEYNVSSRQQTLTIQLTDRDPLIAAQMLDSTVKHLQNIVTEARHCTAGAMAENLVREYETSKADYYAAQDKYSAYCDSHRSVISREVLEKKESLRNEMNLERKHYLNASRQYARQVSLQERDYCSFAVIEPVTVPISDTSRPMVYVVVFIFFAVSGVRGYKLLKQRIAENVSVEFGGLFSPWSITIIVWGIVFLLLSFSVSNKILEPLTKQFYLSISLWIVILATTSFVTFNLLPHKTIETIRDGISFNQGFFYLFFGITIVILPLYLYRIFEIVSLFGSENMLNDIRVFATDGDGVGRLVYSELLSYAMFMVSLWAYPKVKKWIVVTAMVSCVLCAIAIMEKGTLFFVLVSGIYVSYERGVIKLRTIVAVCAVFIGLMFLFNIAREGMESEYAENETFVDFLSMYVTSPSVAFCRVRQEVSQQFGINTFAVIYTYLNRFELGQFEIHSKLQEFVFVPASTNVYTVLQPFFRDFGYPGVAFFAWIYGILYGIVYRYSKNGNGFCICLYTYLVEVLILQFFQENLFLSMGFNAQLLIILLCCTLRTIKISR